MEIFSERNTFNITEELLLDLIGDKKFSEYEMAKYLNSSQGNIQFWIDKYGLRIFYQNNRKFRKNKPFKRKSLTDSEKMQNLLKYDWESIQKYYDMGRTWVEVSIKYNVPVCALGKARKMGLFKTRTKEQNKPLNSERSKGRKQSERTKKKISIARKKYLSQNNIPAWKTHDKFKSQPCEWLKKELKNRNYKFVEELSPLKHKGRYFSMDIAFPEIKFAIEINGRQHYDASNNLTPYYQTRHDLIEAEGWEIWEVKYHETRSPLFLEKVIQVVDSKLVGPSGVAPEPSQL